MVSEITGRRLKVLLAVNEIYPDDCGGVHTYIYEQARGLAARGHEVFVLTKNVDGRSRDGEVIEGVNIHRYKVKKRSLAFLDHMSRVFSVRREFKKLIASHVFDLINFHSMHTALGIAASGAAKEIPRTYHFHAPLHEEERLNAPQDAYAWYQWRRYVKPLWFPVFLVLMKTLEARALKSCRKIFTLSDFTSQYVKRTYNISCDKILKVPGGVDVRRFKPAENRGAVRRELRLPADKRILLTVRRLVPRMGLDNLIRAMPLILKSYPETILLIGGEGVLRQQLQRLIDKLRLGENILLLGFLDSGKLPLFYQASDLFILPTRELEGFGMVTTEALACGLPVLGTPVGGTREVLGGFDTGMLFNDNSAGSMAELIVEYLRDTGRREEARSRCRRHALDNYSWDSVILRLEKSFLEVAGSGRDNNGVKTESRRCPVCRSSRGKKIYRERGCAIAKCRDCGYMYSPEIPSQEEFADVYHKTWSFLSHVRDSSFAELTDMDRDKMAHIKQYKKQGRILDLGCGTGRFLHLAEGEGFDAVGVELSLPAAEFAKRRFTLRTAVSDIENASIKDKSFDIVTMFHTLEHLRDPCRALQNIHRILRKDGIVVLAVPNASAHFLKAYAVRVTPFLKQSRTPSEYHRQGIERYTGEMGLPYHINFNTPSSLTMMLERAGFERPRSWSYNCSMDCSNGDGSPMPRKVLKAVFIKMTGMIFNMSGINLSPELSVVSRKIGD